MLLRRAMRSFSLSWGLSWSWNRSTLEMVPADFFISTLISTHCLGRQTCWFGRSLTREHPRMVDRFTARQRTARRSSRLVDLGCPIRELNEVWAVAAEHDLVRGVVVACVVVALAARGAVGSHHI